MQHMPTSMAVCHSTSKGGFFFFWTAASLKQHKRTEAVKHSMCLPTLLFQAIHVFYHKRLTSCSVVGGSFAVTTHNAAWPENTDILAHGSAAVITNATEHLYYTHLQLVRTSAIRAVQAFKSDTRRTCSHVRKQGGSMFENLHCAYGRGEMFDGLTLNVLARHLWL